MKEGQMGCACGCSAPTQIVIFIEDFVSPVLRRSVRGLGCAPLCQLACLTACLPVCMSARMPVCMEAGRPAKPSACLTGNLGAEEHVGPPASLPGHLPDGKAGCLSARLQSSKARPPGSPLCLLACRHARLSAGSRLVRHILTWWPISARFKANLARNA